MHLSFTLKRFDLSDFDNIIAEVVNRIEFKLKVNRIRLKINLNLNLN